MLQEVEPLVVEVRVQLPRPAKEVPEELDQQAHLTTVVAAGVVLRR